MTEKKSYIPSRLKNASVGGHVAGAADIYDDALEKTQDAINNDLYAPSEGIISRVETLEDQVHFSGSFQTENTPAGVTSGSGKITTSNAVRGAIDVRTGYFECATAGSTARKDVLAAGFVLTTGGHIKVKMTSANTADNATMNISPDSTVVSANTKTLYYNGEPASASNSWEDGEVISVYYDGTYYQASNAQGGSKDIKLVANAVKKTLLPIHSKKVSIIGDSISTYAGTWEYEANVEYPNVINIKKEDMWWHLLFSIGGAELEVNASYGGSCVAQTPNYPDRPTLYSRASEPGLLGNPDYIFIQLGYNDYSKGVALGLCDFNADIEDLDITKFIPAYIKGIKALRENYPSAEVVLMIFPMGNDEVFADAVRMIGNYYGYQVIDVRDYYIGGDVHPDKDGMEAIAHLCCNNLISPQESESATLPMLSNSKGYILNNGDALGAVVSDSTADGWRYIKYPVNEGDVAIISGTGSDSARLWAICDEDNNIIDKEVANALRKGLIKTMPSNAKYLVVNCNLNSGVAVPYEGLFAKAGSNLAHNLLSEEYLYDDIRELSKGKTYRVGELVKAFDYQLQRVIKEIGVINLTNEVSVGDVKVNGSNTYEAQKPISVYNEEATYSTGDYAIKDGLLSQYDGSTWSTVTLSDYVADSEMWDEKDVYWLSSSANGVVEQNNISRWINDKTDSREAINLSLSPEVSYRIVSSTGKFSTKTTDKQIFVEVEGGSEYLISASSDVPWVNYAWVTNINVSSGGNPAYCSGETTAHTVNKGIVARIIAPIDAKFICISTSNQGTNVSPSALIKVQGIEGLGLTVKELDEKTSVYNKSLFDLVSTGVQSSGEFQTTNNSYVVSSSNYGYWYDVTSLAGKRIKLAKGTGPMRIAFTNAIISSATTNLAPYLLSNILVSDSDFEVEIPMGSQVYLWIHYIKNSISRFPSSVLLNTPVNEAVEELDSLRKEVTGIGKGVYTGEKINLRNEYYFNTIITIMDLDAGTNTSYLQGADVFGDYFFQFYVGGRCCVYNLTTLSKVKEFTLSNFSSEHFGSIHFSNEYENTGDTLPLLYTESSASDGDVLVININPAYNGTGDAELVRTITLADYPYTNVCCAFDFSAGIGYMIGRPVATDRFGRYYLQPFNIQDGSYDIEELIDVKSSGPLQDATFRNGVVYIVSGWNNLYTGEGYTNYAVPQRVTAVNVEKKAITAVLETGIVSSSNAGEPEGIAIYDNSFYISRRSSSTNNKLTKIEV